MYDRTYKMTMIIQPVPKEVKPVSDFQMPIPAWAIVAFFFAFIVLAILAGTPWAQQRVQWMGSQKIHILLGLLLGVGLAVLCVTIAYALVPLVTKTLPIDMD
jgi:Flp pilus assembly protein protease CpaA